MMRTRYLSIHKKLFSLAMRALPCWSALQLQTLTYTTVSDKIRYDQSFERSGVAFTARPIGAPPKTIPERYAQVLSKGPTLFKGVPYVLCHVPNFVRITHSTAI